MAVKNISTCAKICGRSAKCTGGHSAVEQAGYISREKMYSEFDGQTYYYTRQSVAGYENASWPIAFFG